MRYLRPLLSFFLLLGGAAAVAVTLVLVLGYLLLWLTMSDAEPPPPPVPNSVPEETAQPARLYLPKVKGQADLLLDIGNKRFLIRDPVLIRAAATTGLPDTSADSLKLMMLSIAFLSPPGTGFSETSLTLQREGRVITRISCLPSACQDDETQRLIDRLRKGGRELASHYESYADHGEYLRAWQAAQDSDRRFGPMDPPQPEALQRLTESAVLVFPIAFGPSDSSVGAEAYRDALREALLRRLEPHKGDIALDRMYLDEEDFVTLARCSDTAPPLDAQGQVLRPAGLSFYAASARIRATPAGMDMLQAIKDWDWLPAPPGDRDALQRANLRAMTDAGLPPDPDGCYLIEETEAGDQTQLWRDHSLSYGFLWTEILPPGKANGTRLEPRP